MYSKACPIKLYIVLRRIAHWPLHKKDETFLPFSTFFYSSLINFTFQSIKRRLLLVLRYLYAWNLAIYPQSKSLEDYFETSNSDK